MAPLPWQVRLGGTGAPEPAPVAYPLLNQVCDSGMLT
jgi:hypothetical protein